MCITCGCSEQQHDLSTVHHHQHQDEITINFASEILAENAKYASENRRFFKQRRAFALNLLSSPGAGKTSLLEATIAALSQQQLAQQLYVIEGDQQTELDAERIRRAGAEAVQIQTGKACHLDGHMLSHALTQLDITADSYVFIENVGNLICPALFDLGEHAKVVLFTVTEGEDKPLKYPDIFLTADVVIITKTDLLPYLQFDMATAIANINKINAKTKILQLSVYNQQGMAEWLAWLASAKVYWA